MKQGDNGIVGGAVPVILRASHCLLVRLLAELREGHTRELVFIAHLTQQTGECP
ncbi:hypothetical protein EDD90_10646 [Streptomyces sp. Ag109_O5-1]|uniref:hypothetical protein n=1 Tax=Streptomyces sp. Ag109_O5-1 TaxID=1938851 RepID=UPI000FB37E51|nr:hypothetical protein [Streptomyces sp. Ag109_O5-1]RPE47194.1 hypothetical protein EDD90_10646 [Streptomyces sp. Ag109_O5-1]